MVGMRNYQDIFETRKRSFISTFSICMTVPLRNIDCVIDKENATNIWRKS